MAGRGEIELSDSQQVGAFAQTALLSFRGVSFPHVTVGTLTKDF
jgi:hypothetical protein